MQNKKFSDLYDVIEKIRKEKYPDISSELLRKILTIEYENQDDQVKAYREIESLIKSELEKIPLEDNK